MYETVPAYILFIWLSAYPNSGYSTVATAPFWTQKQCEYAAGVAMKRRGVETAYCIKTH